MSINENLDHTVEKNNDFVLDQSYSNKTELEEDNLLSESPSNVKKESLRHIILSHTTGWPRRLRLIALLLIIVGMSLFLYIIVRYVINHQTRNPKPQVHEMIDPIHIKGKHEDAYGLFLCTRSDAAAEEQLFFDALRISIFRLIKMEENSEKKRDIIVIVCQFVSPAQVTALRNLPIIVVPVLTINPPFEPVHYRWIDNYTKFHFWRFLNWNRILYIDIDIFFMDDFLTIWDEPVAQVIDKPPKPFSSEDTYLGYKVKDLYPYLFAVSIDTWRWEYFTLVQKFNAGLLMLKPSLTHFHILMDVSFYPPMYYYEMEQTTLNYMYSHLPDVAVPFSELNATYNFFIEYNANFTESRKAYHVKLWGKDLPEHIKPLGRLWESAYKEMKLTYQTVSILSTNAFLSSESSSIVLKGLSLSSGSGIIYAVASTNYAFIPRAEQIMAGLDASGTYAPNAQAKYDIYPAELKFNKLQPDTTYLIYYVATTGTLYARMTDVYYIQARTL
jgi:alpha-N-acetylglucosamine transferase